jgi:hypothetical protein
MTEALRHHCRYDRVKLSEPTDNPRRAFCCRGCFNSFYRSRCVVCEEPIRRKNEQQKTCISRKCKAEIRRFPLAYSWSKEPGIGNHPSDDRGPSKTPDFIGSKRPLRRCLREWSWGGDGGDHSLYDKDGLTIARLVLANGRYYLRTPIIRPVLSLVDLDEAKQRAEEIAVANLLLVTGVNVEAAELARINAMNTKSHPMGRPLNLSFTVPFVDSPPIAPCEFFEDDPLEIPAFLLRKKCDAA